MIDFGSSDDATHLADEYGLINGNAWKYKSNEQNEININVGAATATPTPRNDPKKGEKMNGGQKNAKGSIRFALGGPS